MNSARSPSGQADPVTRLDFTCDSILSLDLMDLKSGIWFMHHHFFFFFFNRLREDTLVTKITSDFMVGQASYRKWAESTP